MPALTQDQSLDVIIVGAGIAGLAAGISLRRAGHNVRIFERSELNNEVGAAIHVPPNANRALVAWGLDPAENKFVPSKGIAIGSGATLQQFDFTPLGDFVPKVFGGPLYFAHRVDLHESLKKLAMGPEGPGKPVELNLGVHVVAYNPEEPSVTLSSGIVKKGDLVIAADGVHSIAVEAILGYAHKPEPQAFYNGCYRFLIPAAELDADEETAWWNKNGEKEGLLRIYTASKLGNRFVSYPCRGGEVWNCVGMFHDEELIGATKEDWQTPVDKSHVLKTFAEFHPSLQAVLNKASDVKRWPLLYRGPVATWTKEKMIIIGDAAHPMLPHQGQGGAQGIEDGIALGISLSGATSEDIKARLALFEKARRHRASAIQVMSNAGPDQAERVTREVAQYVSVPLDSQAKFAEYNWGHDIVDTMIQLLRESVDAKFELPEGFFKGNPFSPQNAPNCQYIYKTTEAISLRPLSPAATSTSLSTASHKPALRVNRLHHHQARPFTTTIIMSAQTPLRIGFVPEHFSTPLHFAQKHYGLSAELVPFPSGTGHMITSLRSGEIDVAVGLTEGWVAGLGKDPSIDANYGTDGGYRLVGTYVETPLCWAISTGANRAEIESVDSLKGGKIGVSRIGSGSYVMGYVLADQRNWLVPTTAVGTEIETASPFSDFVVLNTFQNLRDAVNDGRADFFMWEHFTSKKYYDSGEIRRVGEIYTPWSSWKIVASTRLLEGAEKKKLDERVEEAMDKVNEGIKHFEEHQDEAVKYISTELDYSEEDAREWLKTVKFPKRVQGVDKAVIDKTVNILRKAGVLIEGRGMKPEEMIAKTR
ncbi:hypothetical protein QBC32DRAFT_368362 [Pseudoneurospora amorphoporcata]|uniref:FAD-binding domain-containing protein n=1 Tax=Pseudoneurospora amorphoporcata TaxID=241081 RepID=A0AAN6NZF2_9PEZI|nr:hypothetical protein QBC32DRAFT_368362 [Pseudoneurospora amorphoporcata]